jgi:hypothetical protein
MPFVSKRADLLERSIQGLPCADQEVRGLIATAARIPALTSPACGPRDEFVSALGLQLRAGALALPAREVGRAPSTSVARRPGTKPMVFVIGKGLRVIAGATASLLLIGAVLGVTSRSALPGGLLYPVKQVLNSAAVQLAGSDLDRGVTLLSQAQEHIGDARSLVERDGARADPTSVDQSVLSASDAVIGGQQALLRAFDRTGNVRALISIQDFTVRAMTQLNALRPLVPAASKPDVDALIALLGRTRTTLALKIAVCGQRCAAIGGVRPGRPPPSAPAPGPPSTHPGGGLPMPGRPAGGLPVVGPVPAISGSGAVVVGPVAPTAAITKNGTGGVLLPPVTVGSLTVSPSPIVIAPLPRLSPLAPTLGLSPVPGLP